MDPFPAKVPTQATVDQAFEDKLKATLKAVSIIGTLSALNYRLNAPGGSVVQKGLQIGVTGVEAKPTEAGRAALKVPVATFFAAALPQPVGFVPAEAYNLHPEFYKQVLGFKVGQKPPFFSATDARIEVYEARAAAADIGARALQVERFNHAPTIFDRTTIPPGPINVTTTELEFLKALPPGLSAAQDLIPQLDARRADLIASGSTSPATVEPTNDNAIRNFAKKIGIDRELASERADP